MFMTADDFRESLRRYSPRVYCDGDLVESVADEPRFRPGVDAIGVTYDFALEQDYKPLMVAEQHTTGQDVNRMLHICRTPQDLINKLEAVRLMCREVGCAQRYLTHDALNAIYQATFRIDADKGTDTHQRFLDYLHKIQSEDLTLGVCGEHGGDPSSIEFCNSLGLDYVSCSPFRVPIARLAAAQAALKNCK